MEFSDAIKTMSRRQLLSYLDGLVSRLDKDDWNDTQAKEFSALVRKVRDELSDDETAMPNFYKVFCRHKGFECNIKYFSTLCAAKREIKERLRALRKNPLVAQPYEVVSSRSMEGSVAEDNFRSIISNWRRIWIAAPDCFPFRKPVRAVAGKQRSDTGQVMTKSLRKSFFALIRRARISSCAK